MLQEDFHWEYFERWLFDSGEWKKGLREGRGSFTYANGDKYDGDFKNDERNGEGTYTYQNGDIYKGSYENDLRHGPGTYTYADDDESTYGDDNKIFHVEYKKGRLVSGGPLKEKSKSTTTTLAEDD